jgi:anaphase-promoting complex subunit 1
MASAICTMALALGRGALTLGTAHPLPTEPLVIPPLCLSGVDPDQGGASINLDLSTAQSAPGQLLSRLDTGLLCPLLIAED